MSKATSWFWTSWLGDLGVRRLSPAARGLWIDCLALMDAGFPRGYLTDYRGRCIPVDAIARIANTTPEHVAELLKEIIEEGVASIDQHGTIYNRRMIREEAMAVQKRKGGQQGAKATRLKWLELSGLSGQMSGQMSYQAHQGICPQTKERKIDPLLTQNSEPRPQAADKQGVAEKAGAAQDAVHHPPPANDAEVTMANHKTLQPNNRVGRKPDDPTRELRSFARHEAEQRAKGLDPLRMRTAEECGQPTPVLRETLKRQARDRRAIPDMPEARPNPPPNPPSGSIPVSDELAAIAARWKREGLTD